MTSFKLDIVLYSQTEPGGNVLIIMISLAHFVFLFRWHRTVSENLVNQNVLVPNEEQSSDSDSGSFTASEQKKRGLGHKMKFFLGKIIQSKVKESQSMKLSNASSSQNSSPMTSPKQYRLPKIIQHLPLTRQTEKGSRRRISQAGKMVSCL